MRARDVKRVSGWWLPASDEYHAELLTSEHCLAYKRRFIDGRRQPNQHRAKAALSFVPMERRRVAVDVGANLGWWAYHLAQNFDFTLCFEPMPLYAECLMLNMPDGRHWQIEPAALGGGFEEEAPFVVDRDRPGRSHLAAQAEAGDIRVPVRTLDSYQLPHLDLLKIDVEGFERNVLFGGKHTIRRYRPMVVLEQLGHEARYGEQANSAGRVLARWGAVQLRKDLKGDQFWGWR